MEKIAYRRAVTGIFYSLLAIIALAAVTVFYIKEITDSDIWFHLAYGRYFVEHHCLTLDHTIFSSTPADNNTIYCCWLPEILFYLLYKTFGLSVFFILRYVSILIVILLTFSFIRKLSTNLYPIALLILLIGLLMSLSGLRIKPELFSFTLMTVMVWAWFKVKSLPDKGYLFCYVFPLIMLIWVNSHGGFIFGAAFLAVIFAGELVNRVSGSLEMVGRNTRKHLIISILLSAVAIFITPYGYDYPFHILKNTIIDTDQFGRNINAILEYKSIFDPDMRNLHLIYYLAISSAILIPLMITFTRKHGFDWSLFLSNALFSLLYMKFVRSTYFWAIIFMFSSVYLLRKTPQLEPDLFTKKPVKYLLQPIVITMLLFFSVWAPYEACCSPDFGFRVFRETPVIEADYIRRHFPNLSIGNDYISGAYLLWSFWPGKRVFLDARCFPYSKWYSEYVEFAYGDDDAQKDLFVKKYKCDLWCLSHFFPAIEYFLKSPDWKLVFYGPSACIFVSNRIAGPTGREISDDVYTVPFYQSLRISYIALTAGDVRTAKRLLTSLKPMPLCKEQRDLLIGRLFGLGNAMSQKGHYQDAVDVFSRIIGIDPRSADSYFNRGNAQSKLGDLNGAIRSYKEAIRIRPDFVTAHNNLAIALVNTSRLDEAINEYMRILELDPGNMSAAKNLAVVRQFLEKLNYQIVLLTRKSADDPNNPVLIHALALCHANKGDFDTPGSTVLVTRNE